MTDDFDLMQLKRNPQWRVTLEVYYELSQKLREESPDSDGWISRPAEFEGVDPSQVSVIHGKLIAYGFLKFDVSGRDLGVRYQLTYGGRRAVLGQTAPEADTDDAELVESA